jgi:hypothetical protein
MNPSTKTANHLFVVGLAITSLLSQPANLETTDLYPNLSGRPIYKIPNNGSYASFSKQDLGSKTLAIQLFQTPRSIEQVLSAFFSDLLSKQNPLENDVAHALFENRWELYAR